MKSKQKKQRLRTIVSSLRPVMLELVTISFFINLLVLALPIFILQVYDRVVSNASITTLQALAVGVLIAIAFDFILRQTRSRLLQRASLRYDVEVGPALYNKIHALPLRTLEERPTAFWSGLFRDVETVRNTIAGPPVVLLVDLPFAVVFLLLIYVIATPIIWVLFIALPVFILLALRSGSAVRAASEAERDASLGRDGLIAEMIAHRTSIKALSLDDVIRPSWEDRHADTIERSLIRGRKGDGFYNLSLALSVLTTISIVGIGALAVIDQKLTIGALVATTMLSSRIVNPFAQLVHVWRQIMAYRQSMKRLKDVFKLEEELQEDLVEMERPKGRLVVDAVSFSYAPEATPVMDEVGFSLSEGGIHAIVGRNGCGKTTLLKIIHGLYRPHAGQIMLDGADIAQFSRRQLSRWIGYVPQETVLLDGTIRDNIAKGWEDVSDEEIVRVAESAGVHQFVVAMPDGYATAVGEGGHQLSGGQRQRIAIARALIGDPPLLLLDEPSSSLDRAAEEALRATLMNLSRDHTILVVTHSPILLSQCHNVLVLEKGKIVLSGPPSEVLPRAFGQPKVQPMQRQKA